MTIFKTRLILLSVILAVAVSVIAAGCCANKTDKDKAIIAKINGYELYSSDFAGEARLVAPNMRLPADPEKAKVNILDELITKKVLLQEAQRENFDKDKEFMKEIERYWEQALLKLLIKRKIDEFSKSMPAAIQGDARQEKLQSELDKWITDMRNSAKVKIYEENLKAVDIK